MKKIALLLYTVIVLVLAANCDRRAEYLTASGAMLGTTFQATGDITDCTAQELYRAIMQIDAEAKASMSIFDSTSLLSRINRGETDFPSGSLCPIYRTVVFILMMCFVLRIFSFH